jgi:hypothetical protein
MLKKIQDKSNKETNFSDLIDKYGSVNDLAKTLKETK